ncbi:iron-containing alcohol dehydrogenase [Chloroflexota bacterium]
MVDKISVFMCKTELYHGFGASSITGDQAARFGIKRAFLVTDRGIRASGLLQGIEDSLKSANIDYQIFDDVEEDPSSETIHRGVEKLQESSCDGVVILGGGSPICAGRGMALLATNRGKIQDYAGINMYKVPPLPVICLPTTAGSGSDVSRTFIFHDTSKRKGSPVDGDDNAPVVSILDPLLLKTCPPKQMVISGMDALSHAVESLWTTKSTPLTDALAYESIRLIMGNLKDAAFTDNMEAKSIQHLAASMANFACGNAGLSIPHGMHPDYDMHLPHGYVNAILLPYAMEFNLPECESKLAQMALILGESPSGKNLSDMAKLALKRLKQFYIDLNLPRKFKPEEMPVDKIPELARGVIARKLSIERNIRKLTENDIILLYESSVKGWQLD